MLLPLASCFAFWRADAGVRPATDGRRCDDGRRGSWAATTLVIKASASTVSRRKRPCFINCGIGAVVGFGAIIFGERVTVISSMLALGIARLSNRGVVSVTFVAWFALIIRYSASRLSVFTFWPRLFGAAAGHVLWGDP